jgi:flagellar protein FliS
MAAYGKSAYAENEILQADPIGLVRLLYQAALDAVTKSRRHLRNGEIRDRSRQITRAMEALAELSGALDREMGGEIAANLGRLYEYMSRRLQEANALQIEPPLVEVERLLATLSEAWNEIGSKAGRESELAEASAISTWAAEDGAYSPAGFAG